MATYKEIQSEVKAASGLHVLELLGTGSIEECASTPARPPKWPRSQLQYASLRPPGIAREEEL
jgi:hypothetical protein